MSVKATYGETNLHPVQYWRFLSRFLESYQARSQGLDVQSGVIQEKSVSIPQGRLVGSFLAIFLPTTSPDTNYQWVKWNQETFNTYHPRSERLSPMNGIAGIPYHLQRPQQLLAKGSYLSSSPSSWISRGASGWDLTASRVPRSRWPLYNNYYIAL